MAEKPIIFSAPMVRAILGGSKTQTRRVAVKTSQPRNVFISDFDAGECKIEIENKISGTRSWESCPYGQPGDRLWVRENFSIGEDLGDGWEPWMSQGDRFLLLEDGGSDYRVPEDYLIPRNAKETHHNEGTPEHWRQFGTIPSIFMPRWASRILLEITAVRVERLQDISGAAAISEGVEAWIEAGGEVKAPYPGFDGQYPGEEGTILASPARIAFYSMWESINGPASWAANPWVWVIEFKRVEVAHG